MLGPHRSVFRQARLGGSGDSGPRSWSGTPKTPGRHQCRSRRSRTKTRLTLLKKNVGDGLHRQVQGDTPRAVSDLPDELRAGVSGQGSDVVIAKSSVPHLRDELTEDAAHPHEAQGLSVVHQIAIRPTPVDGGSDDVVVARRNLLIGACRKDGAKPRFRRESVGGSLCGIDLFLRREAIPLSPDLVDVSND